MSRPINFAIGSALAVQAMAIPAQPADALEAFLAEHALEDLLAEHLVEQLATTGGEERALVAQRLGRLYIDLLDSAETEEDRQYWSGRASNLLRLVPEADSPGLRINLGKAAYVRAGSIAERVRLRMASEEEQSQAERLLRDTSATFLSIAQDSNALARRLERKLAERLEEDEEVLATDQLAEARQHRSLSFYYAGWSEYYLSVLTGDKSRAGNALRHFGWLLGSRDGEEATYDRIQPGLLRYEHVARASIGASLACSELGRHVEAVAWLDAVDRSTDVPSAIRDQVFDRRLWIYSRGGLWPDLELLVRRARASGTPLEAMSARTLVVGCMEALGGSDGRGRSRELIRRLADSAFEDLVRAGKVTHVFGLVRAFGESALGDDGFVVLYVRGLLALERADGARDAAGLVGEGPVEDRVIAAFYREAGNLLLASVDEPDAGRHPAERVRAMTAAGNAMYVSGEPLLAADVLERALAEAESPEQAESALWLAVVVLDEAVTNGDASLVPRRDQAAQLFLSTYPASERAARLLTRPGTSGLLPDEEAIEVLLAVPQSSPNYLIARRQATHLLYRAYRSADPSQRAFAAQRLCRVGTLLLRAEQAEVRSGDVSRAERAAELAILTARRIADAALALDPPDVSQAEFALDTIDRVASYADRSIDDFQDEIAYRRLQIAVARSDEAAIARWRTDLESGSSGYAVSAVRLLYRESVKAWIDDPTSVTAARGVVRYGPLVLEQFQADTDSRVRLGVVETVSQAAAGMWEAQGDRAMLTLAIDMNQRLIDQSAGSGPVLRRQAMLLESGGQHEASMLLWRRLVAGLQNATPEWFEARYESIRLLADIDTSAAARSLSQHVTLYPDLGPEPWGDRFRQLARRLNVEVSP